MSKEDMQLIKFPSNELNLKGTMFHFFQLNAILRKGGLHLNAINPWKTGGEIFLYRDYEGR